MFKKKFKKIDNLFKFEISDNVTKNVTAFYDFAPFPNYKNHQNKHSLNSIGENNFLFKQLKKFLGNNSNFIEIGSGTSQVSNYLAYGTNNKIYAFDPTLKSLEMGQLFAKNNNINNIFFVNADIYDDVIESNSFDVALCSGVLHHTRDPYESFSKIPKILKKNGYVIIGLYNSYGRIRTKIRRMFYKYFGKKFVIFFDPILRNLNKDPKKNAEKIKSWINDQYEHPVESTHSFDEVLRWFELHNIEFINSIPSCDCATSVPSDIFKKSGITNKMERIFQQIRMNFNSFGDEGGLFIFIGKKW
tara:strand:+ start:148 stop:1053 length:906 start_codon:yes stop_codon:yes gene_type:complete